MGNVIIKKYAPKTIGFVIPRDGWVPNVPVHSYRAYPPGQHPENTGIKKDCFLLEFVTQYGSRYRGFQNCYIDSSLQMVCELLPGQERDEVIMKTWKDAE